MKNLIFGELQTSKIELSPARELNFQCWRLSLWNNENVIKNEPFGPQDGSKIAPQAVFWLSQNFQKGKKKSADPSSGRAC